MLPDPPPRSPIPEPFSGEPVDLPIESDGRVRVWTELGVDIYFCPRTAAFTARISGVEGKGSTSELRSVDFAAVVARIRLRTLVVPVVAYLLGIDEQASDDADVVVAIPCTVIEHHPRRGEPFVVRVLEMATGPLGRHRLGPIPRIRTVPEVYLPAPEQLARLRAATLALRDEHVRHRAEVARLGALQRVALDAVRKLDPDDLQRVQASGAQLALEPGALAFDLDPEEGT